MATQKSHKNTTLNITFAKFTQIYLLKCDDFLHDFGQDHGSVNKSKKKKSDSRNGH